MSELPNRRRAEDPQSEPARAGAPGTDRRTGARPERRRNPDVPRMGGRRHRDLLHRYRQPILGLGLLGAAGPLVHQQAQQSGAEPQGNPEETAPAPQQAAAAAAAAAAGTDTEEQLAGRIAESRQQDARTRYVSAAVAEYGIAEDLAADIFDIAQQENVDPEIAIGLVRTESTFDERAVSHVGARGLTQVMPRTARGIVPGTRAEELFDRKTNLRLGFRYLDQLVQKYRGNVELALTAYNRGPGTVDKVLKRGGDPDNGYAGKVLKGS